MPNCPQCHHTHVIKHGKRLHKQRFRCKHCLFTFVEQDTRAYPESMRRFAIYLYLQGQSLRSVAKTLMVSPATVMLWIRHAGEEVMKRESTKRFIAEVEIDEMWHYLEKKKRDYGFSKPLTEPRENS